MTADAPVTVLWLLVTLMLFVVAISASVCCLNLGGV